MLALALTSTVRAGLQEAPSTSREREALALRTQLNAARQATARAAVIEQIAALQLELRDRVEEGRANDDERRAAALTAELLANLASEERPRDLTPIELMHDAVTAALPLAVLSSDGTANQQEIKARVVWGLAWRLTDAGAFEECHVLLRGALDTIPAPRMRARFMLELAAIARLTRHWQDSLDWVDRAQADATQSLDVRDADLCGERGRVYLELGKLDQAEHWFQLEQRSAEHESASLKLNAALHAIQLAHAKDRLLEAIAMAEQALGDRALVLAWPPAHAELLMERGMARLDLALREPDALASAVADLEAALGDGRLTAPSRTRAQLSLIRERIVAHAWDAAERMIGEIEAAHTTLSAELCALKSRLLRERGADREARVAALAALRTAHRAQLDDWNAVPIDKDGVGFLHFSLSRIVIGELVAAIIDVTPGEEGLRAALQVVLDAQALGTLAREWHVGAPSLSEIRADLLGEGECLLIYLPSRQAGHVFAVTATSLAHASIPATHTVLDRRSDLLSLVMAPPPTGGDGALAAQRLDDAAKRLAQAVLPDDIAALVRSCSLLTIAGLDLLGWFPFECLPLADGTPLGMAKPIAYLPSVPVGMELARRARTVRRDPPAVDCVIVAAPQLDADRHLPEIALDPDDERALTAAYPRGRARIVRGAAATRESVTSAAASGAPVLEILTHGLYDAARRRPAGLVLSDGSLFCDEIETRSMPPLVMLAACGAARGPMRAGEDGVNNLSGALLRAHAEAVILSSADVDLAATLALSAALHEQLRQGRSAAEALRRARIELSSSSAYAHPHDHSLFYVVGLGHHAVFAAAMRPPWTRIAVLGGCVAACLVALARRLSRRAAAR